jgi:hypothetical protein
MRSDSPWARDCGVESRAQPGFKRALRIRVCPSRNSAMGVRFPRLRWLWAGVVGAFVAVGVGGFSPAHAGALNIDSVVLDSARGDTFAAVCQNTKGYFAELGARSQEARLILDLDLHGTPLRDLMGRGVPAGWSIEYGKALPNALRVDWRGRASWVDALEEVARRENLVIVIAWTQKSVYVDKL